ncbi:Ger(x)C family spore germination protein [Bacillus thermotolerans]|uniref:Spore germination protein GerYC n=1 Tax=Bacillus thermotolerans TaxID=1221996 RepID=A0A0F5HJI9_BACTR|nr:Ger(x)C family spore germination protein [Bacillus thermotolerans]KKB33195.1 Spore germination protein GerYC [Bacillus thermotolerans]KKB41852.1 Spore germination protein GerYC [Bacillus thermotolerans]
MKKVLFWTIFVLVIVFSQSIDPSILEDTQLITALGLDYVDEQMVKGTATAPLYPPGQDPKPIPVHFTATARTPQIAVQEFQRESQRPLRVGRMEVYLFSKELAKHGIRKVMDPAERSPQLGRDLQVALVDGSAEKMLVSSYRNGEMPSSYIMDLLEKNVKTLAPSTELHNLMNQLDGFGQDPFLPILEQTEEHIRFTGLAIFKDDQYIDELSFRESYLFRVLFERSTRGYYEVSYKGHYVALMNVASKPDYQFNGPQERPRLTIQLSVEGRLSDAAGLHLDNHGEIKELEQAWAREIKKKTERLTKHFQELGADPLAIGSKARSHYRSFNEAKWEGTYPTIPIEVRVDTTIQNTGLTR